MDKDRDVFKGLMWPFPLQRSGRVGITDPGWKTRPGGMPGVLFCSISGKGAVPWCATGLQAYRGQGRGPVRPEDSQAIFGRRLTSKKGRQARGRVFPGEAGRGPRGQGDATPAAPKAGGTVPPQEERRVAPGRSDRRSREQRVCPSPAFPLGAGRGAGGRNPRE